MWQNQRQNKRSGSEKRTAAQNLVILLEFSRYSRQLEEYFEYFPVNANFMFPLLWNEPVNTISQPPP